MVETRKCDQCGATFTPPREHARFCSGPCRVAWNRANVGDPGAGRNALDWSITAMRDVTQRLSTVAAWDRGPAFAVISEAVWWVTMVDATLMRYQPRRYESVLRTHDADQRRLIEGTFAGLRFVRNRIGYYSDPADFVEPRDGDPGPGTCGVTAWAWRSLPPPPVASLPPRGQEWEMSRYRAYEAHLAGHTIGETFTRAVSYLNLASETAVPAPRVS